jgi:hypothetical protein
VANTYNQELPEKYQNLLGEYNNVKNNTLKDDLDYKFSTKLWEFTNYFPQFNISQILKSYNSVEK